MCSFLLNFGSLKCETLLDMSFPSIVCLFLCMFIIKHTYLLQVVTTGKIMRQDRTSAWRELQEAAIQKKTRPFYREIDKHGRMYAGIY